MRKNILCTMLISRLSPPLPVSSGWYFDIAGRRRKRPLAGSGRYRRPLFESGSRFQPYGIAGLIKDHDPGRFRSYPSSRQLWGLEPNTEPFLEATNGMAECGLRNAELRCGFGEAALSRYGQEGHKVVQMSALHRSLLLIGSCGF